MMKNHWIAVVLLGSTLAVGCGGGAEDTPNSAAEPAPVAEPAPASEAAPASADTAPAQPAAPRVSSAPRSRPAPAPAPSASAPRAEAPRAVAPAAPRYRDVAAPAGTDLVLELTTPVSTETAQIETPVTARLRRSVVVDGVTVFPAGAVFHGNVTEVERPGRVRGRAHLAFRFTEVSIDGQRDPVRTSVLTFEGEATKSEDATKVGAGAGIGAVIGGILGGGGGAAKGAAIGGAAGAGTVLATRGRDVNLEAGTELNATLASSFQIKVEVR